MAADPIIVGKTILSQTIVVANQAAASAARAKHYADLTADKAPLDSPAFVGVPTAPTPAPGTNSTQLATTAYLDRLLGVADGIATLDSSGLIPSSMLPPLSIVDVFTVNSEAAMLALDAQPGDLAVRTDVNETYILTAEPASVLANWTLLLFSAPVTSVAGLTGAITANALMTALGAAPLASPTFTGTPAAPTPVTNVNTTQIPTTAWVNTWYAAKESPTLTGTPTAPTATPGTNTGQIATTEFVITEISALDVGVSSFNGRTGAVSPQAGDYGVGDVTGAAPLASPTFTGTPAAPTPGTNINTTQIPTTAWVNDWYAPKASPTFTGIVTTPVLTGTAVAGNIGVGFTGGLTNGRWGAGLDLTNLGQLGLYNDSSTGAISGTSTPTYNGDTYYAKALFYGNGDLQLGGSLQLPASAYTNFGATVGSSGYGIRDNAGTMEVKNNAGAWAAIGTGGDTTPTGTMRPTLQTTAASGWLMLADGSIGSATSGATYANAAAQNLFTLIFNNTTDANCAIQTSAGAATTRAAQTDAATAWANNCRIFTPKVLGRAFGGAGSGSGLTARALGETVGVEVVTLTSAQQASMTVSGSASVTVSGSTSQPVRATDVSSPITRICGSYQNAATLGTDTTGTFSGSGSGSISGTASGGGGSHTNMEPTTFFNWEIKL